MLKYLFGSLAALMMCVVIGCGGDAAAPEAPAEPAETEAPAEGGEGSGTEEAAPEEGSGEAE